MSYSVAYRREYAPFRVEIGKDIDNSRVDLQLNRMNRQRFKCLLLFYSSSVKKDVLG